MKSVTSLALVAVGLLLVFTYLLLQSAAPDSEIHRRTLEARYAIVLNEAALQRDVLKARGGLLQNYDLLVQATTGLRASTEDLRSVAAIAGGAARREIEHHHAELAAAVEAQEKLVEAFKS